MVGEPSDDDEIEMLREVVRMYTGDFRGTAGGMGANDKRPTRANYGDLNLDDSLRRY